MLALQSCARDECFSSAATVSHGQPSLYLQTAYRPNVHDMTLKRLSPKVAFSLPPSTAVNRRQQAKKS